MSKYYLGIDLGSTTSKAVIIDEADHIVGRGITNTRANYEIAAEIAKIEAIFNARFSLLRRKLQDESVFEDTMVEYLRKLENAFKFSQFHHRANRLKMEMESVARAQFQGEEGEAWAKKIRQVFAKMVPSVQNEFLEADLAEKNQFFRDIACERIGQISTDVFPKDYDVMMLLFDKSITPVENERMDYTFGDLIHEGMGILEGKYPGAMEVEDGEHSHLFDAEMHLLEGDYKHTGDSLREHIDHISAMKFEIANMVGTGYGRALLPFPEECIRSEILCHAYGAHAVFPKTRTVLDIGGQDTKAIQVDANGLVTSFQMNDRCAAGCGRYLGYIADELGMTLNELGPTALDSTKEVNICSTCTVFAGAELRELLNIGEKKEDILSGLHRAIVMRAMSLIARSGGVRDEFTFTGGVARNQAILRFVKDLVHQNYGDAITINVHTDSIFMGALGGAMFARRNQQAVLPKMAKSQISSTEGLDI